MRLHNSPFRLFILVGLLISILLIVGIVPYDIPEMRRADILGDVIMDPEEIIQAEKDSARVRAERQRADSLKMMHPLKALKEDNHVIIDYSSNSTHGMQMFFKALDKRKQMDRPVRIAYYGDSYVEGDILTCDLRQLFQDKFGGSGVGWIDCGSTTNSARPTVSQRTSGFESFAAAQRAGFVSSRQGISQRYFTVGGSANVTYTGTQFRKHCDSWAFSEMFFRSPNGASFTVKTDSCETSLQASASGEVQSVNVDDPTKSVRWGVSGSGITCFGAACESKQGVILDNFAMRGCSGLTLGGIPENTLQEFSRVRPYDMIVIHYGLNATTPSSGERWFTSYAKQMGEIVQKFCRAYPNTTIVIMSIPPRGRKVNGQIVTMKGIEGMVECQRKIAEENQVVFINLFEAIGGQAAIGKLAERKYVGHDYTHISFKGGEYIAKILFEELMKRY